LRKQFELFCYLVSEVGVIRSAPTTGNPLSRRVA
jgi:hypothetical protein